MNLFGGGDDENVLSTNYARQGAIRGIGGGPGGVIAGALAGWLKSRYYAGQQQDLINTVQGNANRQDATIADRTNWELNPNSPLAQFSDDRGGQQEAPEGDYTSQYVPDYSKPDETQQSAPQGQQGNGDREGAGDEGDGPSGHYGYGGLTPGLVNVNGSTWGTGIDGSGIGSGWQNADMGMVMSALGMVGGPIYPENNTHVRRKPFLR